MLQTAYTLAPSVEMDKRHPEAQELWAVAFDPEEQPCFVSDEATLGGLSLEDETELRQKIEHHYGVSVNAEHLRVPVWQFLDYLSANRVTDIQLASVGSQFTNA